MELKDLEVGQTIYAYPTGNNARYRRELIAGTVEGVGRKYATINFGIMPDKYCLRTGATASAIKSGYGLNGGYVFFLSRRDFTDWERKNTLSSNIASMARDLNFRKRLEELGDSDLQTLERILSKLYVN